MNFEDFKENLLNSIKMTWERFQESSFYNNLMDRYDDLSPSAQKIALLAASIGIVLVLMMLPISYLLGSNTYIAEYNEKRDLIRQLLKSTREANEVPEIAQAPSIDSLKSIIENSLRSSNLLPEQILAISPSVVSTSLFPSHLSSGAINVSLSQLNQQQIVDIGYKLQGVGNSVKLKDISIVANAQNPQYFDVIYQLITLATPSADESIDDTTGISKGKTK